MPRLGQHFGGELIAAGLADGVMWSLETGEVFTPDDWTDAQKEALADLLAAHDPDAVPSEAPAPPTVTVAAVAEIEVEGEEVSGVGTVANFGGGMALMPGTYWIFFAEPQPDTSYIPTVQAPGYDADVTYPLNVDYLEITVTDRATGEMAVPSRLVLDIKRVQ